MAAVTVGIQDRQGQVLRGSRESLVFRLEHSLACHPYVCPQGPKAVQNMVLADPLLPDSATIIPLWLSWDNLAANLSLGQLLGSHALQPAPGGLCDQA